jgi:Predicted nucleotide-binding protein containing TIR-like domain
MTAARLLTERFGELVAQLTAVEATKRHERSALMAGDYVDNDMFLNWKVKARDLISKICGKESEYYKDFERREKAYIGATSYSILLHLKPIFFAVKEDYEKGYLSLTKNSVPAEATDSEPEHEEWISAASALALMGARHSGARTICTRANVGLIKARAERFVRDGKSVDNVDIPANFWWAKGGNALTQNWKVGDFETWINDRTHLQAFGVTFRRSDIERARPKPDVEERAMADGEISEEGRQQLNGGRRLVGGPPQVRALAWDWVRMKELESEKMVTAVHTNKVFIVHGRDDGTRESVARFIDKLGLEAIILHERPNKGRTIITKFREEAEDVGFAVILMTPDDVGKAKDASDLKPRARQNVVFELGFFIGALRPGHVAALVKGEIERPSDFDGVVYISLDEADWQTRLGRELKAAGLDFDTSKLIL